MLCIDGLPWALPKAEDECCAFGAKHISETPFPISRSGGDRRDVPTILVQQQARRMHYLSRVSHVAKNKQTPLGTC